MFSQPAGTQEDQFVRLIPKIKTPPEKIAQDTDNGDLAAKDSGLRPTEILNRGLARCLADPGACPGRGPRADPCTPSGGRVSEWSAEPGLVVIAGQRSLIRGRQFCIPVCIRRCSPAAGRE